MSYKSRVMIACGVFLIVVILSSSAFAQGLVPCTGLNCSFCDFFRLFQNIFNFMVGTLAPIVAVVMVVWGGYQFMISAGNPEGIKKGKNILKNTFIGLIIVYASFLAASYVVVFFAKNTGAVDWGFHGNSFTFSCTSRSSEIDVSKYYTNGKVTINIPADVPPDQRATENILPSMTPDNIVVQGRANIIDVNGEVKSGLTAAANILKFQKIGLSIKDGKRSLADQLAEVAKNCTTGASSSSQCNPATCIPRDTNRDGTVDGGNCPHIKGNAVDVWGMKETTSANGKIKADQCGPNSTCQQDVIRAMKAQGFCVLDSEPWHFEKPKVSANCR